MLYEILKERLKKIDEENHGIQQLFLLEQTILLFNKYGQKLPRSFIEMYNKLWNNYFEYNKKQLIQELNKSKPFIPYIKAFYDCCLNSMNRGNNIDKKREEINEIKERYKLEELIHSYFGRNK